MSLSEQVLSLPVKSLKFVDLELNVNNTIKNDRYNFVKVVSDSDARDVYLMAIHEEQFPKWKLALKISNNIAQPDHFLAKAGSNLLFELKQKRRVE
jgi:hypothetical protein